MRIGHIEQWLPQSSPPQFHGLTLKRIQWSVIQCSKYHDILLNLPTGYGKSLIYQYQAKKLINETIVVFVPLIALVWDTIKQCKAYNIDIIQCTQFNITPYLKQNKLPQILVMTPQRYFRNQMVNKYIDYLGYNHKIHKFIIDQVHCVLQWGNDFRPHYLELQSLKQKFPYVKIIAMSATIPKYDRLQLVQLLKIHQCYFFQTSFSRPNLYYEVQTCSKKQIADSIINFIHKKQLNQSSGIIYCQTINCSIFVQQQLRKMGLNCGIFHSKLSEFQKKKTFLQFMSGQLQIIIATICFGLGVNKKNIRFVVNVGISQSIQAYYQQSGRAGRDGKPAYCLLLSYNGDQKISRYLAKKVSNQKNKKAIIRRKQLNIQLIHDYATSNQCRKNYLFNKLGENFNQCNKTCDICNDETINIIEYNYTQKGKYIINTLQKQKIFFTKKQLIDHLSGKKIKKNYGFLPGNLKGYLTVQNNEIREGLFNLFIKIGALKKKNIKNKYFNQYYQINKQNKFKLMGELKFKIKQKKMIGNGKKNIQLDNRFSKYLQSKSKSVSKIPMNSMNSNCPKEYNKKLNRIHTDQIPKNNQYIESLKSYNQNQQQLKECKMTDTFEQNYSYLCDLLLENEEDHQLEKNCMKQRNSVIDIDEFISQKDQFISQNYDYIIQDNYHYLSIDHIDPTTNKDISSANNLQKLQTLAKQSTFFQQNRLQQVLPINNSLKDPQSQVIKRKYL